MALRFAQGFAVGGEWGGAVLLVAEHSPDKSRGFWASFPQAAVPIGNLLATVVLLTLSRLLTEEQFLAWGWRIGFWLSVVIVAIGYYIRTRVTDAPIFLEVQKQVEQEEHVRYGVLEVLRRYPRGVFTAMGLRFAENIMYYLVVTFSITYLVVNEVDIAEILGYMVIAHIVHMIVIPLIGGLADRIGRKPVYFIGAVLAGTLGLLRLPDVRHEEPGHHPAGDLHRPGHPRVHVRIAAGDHERDVPDAHALLGRLARLPGHLDRRGLARADHRGGAAAAVRLVGAGRDLPRDRRGDHAGRGHLAARDEGLVAARARPHRRGAPRRGCRTAASVRA